MKRYNQPFQPPHKTRERMREDKNGEWTKWEDVFWLKELCKQIKKKLNNILERVELSPPVESDLHTILEMLEESE